MARVSALLPRLITMSCFVMHVYANETSSTSSTQDTGAIGNGNSIIDSASRLQSYWNLRDSLTSKPHKAPLVMDSMGNIKMEVNASLGIANVLMVNDVLQTVTTAVSLRLWWHDPSLAWNTSLHDGVQNLELTAGELWTPRVVIFNSLTALTVSDLMDTFQVNHHGHVYTRVGFNMEVLCKMDLSHFPYDVQSCHVYLGSYSKLIDWTLIQDDVFKDQIVGSLLKGSWTLENVTSYTVHIPLYDEVYPVVKMTLRRKTLFYTVCLVLPMVLTSYMNTLVFLLPPQSGEKVSFLVSLFVSTSIFISFFIEEMPRGLDVMPSVMHLLVVVVSESLLFLIATLLVIRQHQQEESNTGSVSSNVTKVQPQRHDEHPCPLKLAVNTGVCGERGQGCSGHQDHSLMVPSINTRGEKQQRRCVKVTASQLDFMFFVFAVISNTVALAVLLFSQL